MKKFNSESKDSPNNIVSLIKNGHKKIESVLGDMKFAVVIIALFALALVYGTFMESYHGREFANKLVYKSWWFMGMQLLMFLSILTATLARLPLKKRLYGFYTLHSGLLILFIGSFVTYTTGVDGMLELMPNEPANQVAIEEDQFVVSYPDGVSKTFSLPASAFPADISYEEDHLKIKTYLPFSKLRLKWKNFSGDNQMESSSSYTIYNENVSEKLIMSLHPESDFQSMQKLGPLSVHYMPLSLYECFVSPSKSGFLVWDTSKNICYNAEDKDYEIGATPTKNRFMLIPYQGEYLKFFPDFSPLPLNDDLSKKMDTPFRVFSKSLFEQRPNLFLFGKKAAFYTKRKGWSGKEFSPDGEPVKLPWMNFRLGLNAHHMNAYPVQFPVYSRPVQDQGSIIEGDIKAVLVEFYGKEYWVRSDAPLALSNNASNNATGDKRQIRFQIKKKELRLPYQITLKRFKMDKNPGTNDPASYESFVALLDGRKPSASSEEHHVFMNNPLKYDDFTFYQSSYFQIGPDEYGSAFSVNYDPGRWIKYLGSFLLVFGSSWHFIARKRKNRRFFERESTIGKANEKSNKLKPGEGNV
ncbi:MAG: cytochrome c biogenesis protein ResB [Bacteriovoracaceae bacterium]